MPLFYSEEKFHSEQNGELTYRKFWNGAWLVNIPQGAQYGGNYLEDLWKHASRRYVEDAPKDVLILGCGACRNIAPILELWPRTTVDAVDYDPVIVEIGRKIYGNFKDQKVNLIIADAKTFTTETKRRYDLILVDIFSGNRPSPLLKDQQFLDSMRDILRDNGTIIANLATIFGEEDRDFFREWKKAFPESIPARYKSNNLAVARISGVPKDYYNIFQSKVYAEALRARGMTVVGQPGSYYYIQQLPFKTCVITAMHTDTEPDIDLIKKETGLKHGLIIWSPWRRVFAGKPWRRNLLPPLHQKGNGFSIVDKDYKTKWSKTARHDLKKFEIADISIQSVGRDRFIAGLNAATLRESVRGVLSTMTSNIDDKDIEFWTAEKAGEVMGGIALINYDNISNYYVIYTTEKGRAHQTGTGLIDWFYQYALKNNIKYLNFGSVRQPGEPSAWQGFSDFKRKFIDKEIIIRNQYFRFF